MELFRAAPAFPCANSDNKYSGWHGVVLSKSSPAGGYRRALHASFVFSIHIVILVHIYLCIECITCDVRFRALGETPRLQQKQCTGTCNLHNILYLDACCHCLVDTYYHLAFMCLPVKKIPVTVVFSAQAHMDSGARTRVRAIGFVEDRYTK